MSVEQLAILGGAPSFDRVVPLYGPASIDTARVLPEIARTLDSGILTKGAQVRELEDALAAATGSANAVAFSSGLSALTMLLQGLRLDGEVLMPAYVFAPVIQAVLAAGLTPRLVDIDSESWNIDPIAAEAAVGPRTSAILAVHTSGFPAPAQALESIAARRRLRLLFDAAHALGARVSDRPVGSLGIAETFSFTPSKLVVGGEGGAVVTADSRLASELSAARNYGRSAHGDWTGRGISARLPEISALLARISLAGRRGEIERRARLAATYRESFEGVPGLHFQTALHDTTPVYRDISVRVSADEFGVGRDVLRAALDVEGVQTGVYFHPAVPDLPLARRFLPTASQPNPAEFPRARRIAAEVINLPVGPSVTAEDALVIGRLVGQVHEHSRRLRVRFQTVSAPRIAPDPTT